MRYLLDTNVLIHLIRDSKTWNYIDINFEPLSYPKNEPYICFASVAEMISLATRLDWKEKKMNKLISILSEIPIVGVSGNVEDSLIKTYSLIDNYSQGKLKELPLPNGVSSRNMGKNDIWIAATAHAINATLLTTDKDFLHLDTIFCKVCIIENQ